MATVIIGDFRGIQLQQYQTRSNDIALNYKYLLEDTAEYSWFSANAISQLPLLAVDIDSVVIMLGFNDCAYSCVWKSSFKIDQIATNYAETINKLIEQYSSLKFYICSVGPVDAGYAFAEYTGGAIPASVLNDKIKQFNDKLKKKCEATYIDCYSYLKSTSFNTRDGARYSSDTNKFMLSYISSKLQTIGGSSFIPRTSAPIVNSDDIESEQYWVSESAEGLSPFTPTSKYNKSAGDTLPSAAAYAWGRFYEILESEPRLSIAYPEQWYHSTADGYSRGQTPALGAIICWQGGASANINGTDGIGHVAVVEQINDDGSIVTSESKDNNSDYWWLTKRDNKNGNWGASSDFTFQGFIYNPKISSTGAVGDYISSSEVISKNAYLSRKEMQINARYIWNYLSTKGWTLNAVAAMLGNMETESSITPNRCEISKSVSGPSSESPTADDIKDYANRYLAAHGRFPGYGLVQWTGQRERKSGEAAVPNTWENQKYIYWCSERGLDSADIDNQLKRIIWECDNNEQFESTSTYDMTFKEFSTSTLSADYLAKAFLKNYEKSANPDYEKRGKQAAEWFDFLSKYTPEAAPQISLENLKVDKVSPTSVSASFITQNCKTGQYQIFDNKGTKITEGNLTGASSDEIKVISFEYSKLIPNTKYEILAKVVGESKVDIVAKVIDFKTPQDYPEAVGSVVFSSVSAYRATTGDFNLKITKPDYLGYWENDSGYDIQLFINSNCVKTVTSKVANISWKNFNIKEKFGYTPETGDIVQIGVRVWVKDKKGKKIYDSDAAKTSKPICLLNKPIITYLNIN